MTDKQAPESDGLGDEGSHPCGEYADDDRNSDVDACPGNSPLLQQYQGFDGEGGKCRKGSQETDHQQRTHFSRDRHALKQPHREKTHQQRAQQVDGQRAPGESAPGQ